MVVGHLIRDVRILGVLAAGLLLLGWVAWQTQTPSVGAQVDPTSCGHFDSQAEAQAALVSGNVANPENLDPDGDGIACEQRWPIDPNSPPPAYDPSSCGHFDSQADAQAAFDAGEVAQPENLDPDGDGIVCEFAFANESSGSGGVGANTLPNTGIGVSGAGSPLALMIGLLASATVMVFAGRSVRNVAVARR